MNRGIPCISKSKVEPGNVCEMAARDMIWFSRAFFAGLSFIVCCSVYDAYLVFHFREVIHEENQLCRWLISLEPDFVSVFMLAKLSGTAVVGVALAGLWKWLPRIAFPSLSALMIFQCGLMAYLHGYDPLPAKKEAFQLAMATEFEQRQALEALAPALEPTGVGRVGNMKAERARGKTADYRHRSNLKTRRMKNMKAHEVIRHHQRTRRQRLGRLSLLKGALS